MTAARSVRLPAVLAIVAVLATVSACGGASPPGPTVAPSSPATTPSTTGPSCAFQDDSLIRTSPRVQVLEPGATQPTIVGTNDRRRLPCATTLLVSAGGVVTAAFGASAKCDLTTRENQPSNKLAKMVTRDPISVLFRLGAGQATCTITGPNQLVSPCDLGTILSQSAIQIVVTCTQDPTVTMTAYAGGFTWVPRGGESRDVPAGQAFAYDSDTQRTETDDFPLITKRDVAVFAAQADAMNLEFDPVVQAPSAVDPPTITQDAATGLLTATTGQWDGNKKITFSYQWQGACDSANGCSDIVGETRLTYRPAKTACSLVRVVVTARNAIGSATQESDQITPNLCAG